MNKAEHVPVGSILAPRFQNILAGISSSWEKANCVQPFLLACVSVHVAKKQMINKSGKERCWRTENPAGGYNGWDFAKAGF